MKLLNLIQKSFVLRDVRVLRAKVRVAKAIINNQNELDEMNPGYNKTRAKEPIIIKVL